MGRLNTFFKITIFILIVGLSMNCSKENKKAEKNEHSAIIGKWKVIEIDFTSNNVKPFKTDKSKLKWAPFMFHELSGIEFTNVIYSEKDKPEYIFFFANKRSEGFYMKQTFWTWEFGNDEKSFDVKQLIPIIHDFSIKDAKIISLDSQHLIFTGKLQSIGEKDFEIQPNNRKYTEVYQATFKLEKIEGDFDYNFYPIVKIHGEIFYSGSAKN